MGETPTVGRIRKRRRKVLLVAAGGLAVLVLAGVFLCWFLGIHSKRDLLAYRGMRAEKFHPIWKDLALRRIKKGDSLAETIKKHPPQWQEQYGPYTTIRYYEEGVGFNALHLVATNDILIHAQAGSCCWQHTFFESPEHDPAREEAYARYMDQLRLEIPAWHIHRAIKAGQDVFISERIERRDVPNNHKPQFSQEENRRYEQLYGREYLKMLIPATMTEFTAEVSKVLSGDLEQGTTVTFSSEDYVEADLAEPQTVFLHLDDRRVLYPAYEPAELYRTVSAKSLEWYQSLPADELKDFEARCQARMAH